MEKKSILEKVVIQVNPLIESRKKMNLSELRLFALGLQDVKPHITENNTYDVDFPETLIPPKELAELFGGNTGGIANLRRHIGKAFQGYIEIDHVDGGFSLYHIFQKMHYTPSEGLTIKFDDEMKPYILDLLGKPYTSYALKHVFPLTSEYGWRLMELMLQYQGYWKKGINVIKRRFAIDDLRFRLNVPEGKYEGRMNNFRKKILDNPIEEINAKTGYHLTYEVEKEGKKVAAFVFFMEKPEWYDTAGTGETIDIRDYSTKIKEPSAFELAAAQIENREQLKIVMRQEKLLVPSINTWIKMYGFEGARDCFLLAVDHADKRKLQVGSEDRKRYLKSCMDRNIAESNERDAVLKAEIDAREKNAAKDKKKHAENARKVREMLEQSLREADAKAQKEKEELFAEQSKAL